MARFMSYWSRRPVTVVLIVGGIALVVWIAIDATAYLRYRNAIPDDQPRPGVEWVRYYQLGPDNVPDWSRGTVVWSLVDAATEPQLHARIAVADRELSADLLLTPMGDGAFLADVTVLVPPEYGPLTRASLWDSEKLFDSEWEVDAAETQTAAASFVVAPAEMDALADMAAERSALVTVALIFNDGLVGDGRRELQLTLRTGDTGRDAFAEAFAAWGIDE